MAMTEFHHIPLSTDKFIADTAHLSHAARGIYISLLMLLWRSPDARVPNDLDWLSTRLRCYRRERKILAGIIAEFMAVDGDQLASPYLDTERAFIHRRSASAKKSIAHRWAKRDSNVDIERTSNAIQCTQIEDIEPPQPIENVQNPSYERNTSTLTLTLKEVSKKEPPPIYPSGIYPPPSQAIVVPAGKPPARVPKASPRSQIDPDWRPRPEDREFARQRGHDDASIDRMHGHFVDYHLAKGSLMKSWSAAFRTWIRNDTSFGSRSPPRNNIQVKRTRMDDVKDLIAKGWLDNVDD